MVNHHIGCLPNRVQMTSSNRFQKNGTDLQRNWNQIGTKLEHLLYFLSYQHLYKNVLKSNAIFCFTSISSPFKFLIFTFHANICSPFFIITEKTVNAQTITLNNNEFKTNQGGLLGGITFSKPITLGTRPFTFIARPFSSSRLRLNRRTNRQRHL